MLGHVQSVRRAKPTTISHWRVRGRVLGNAPHARLVETEAIGPRCVRENITVRAQNVHRAETTRLGCQRVKETVLGHAV